MEGDGVNTHDKDLSPVWTLDPQAFGAELEAATREAGLSGVDVARRLGHDKSTSVSRWWNGRVGLSDQLVYLVGLARESEAARRKLWTYLGGSPDDFADAREDPEVLPILEAIHTVRRRRDWKQIKGALLEQFRWLGATVNEENSSGSADPPSSTTAARSGTGL